MGFVDLHSHVLGGLDDGAPDTQTGLAMVRGLVALGYDEVTATPHQKAGQYLPSLDAIDRAFADTLGALATSGPRLRLAAENMWDDVFFERWQKGEIPCYSEVVEIGVVRRPTQAFLVEFPLSGLPVGVEQHLFKMRTQGLLPVLAHPERYHALWHDDALAARLAQHAVFLVDLGAVAGAHGRQEGKAARAMLERGLAHAVASDAHTLADVALAGEGLAWIKKKLGPQALTRLASEAPRQILSGEHP